MSETRQVETQMQLDEAPAGSLLAGLLQDFGLPEGETDTFFAELPNGRKLLCKKVIDAKAMKSLQKAANKWGHEQSVQKVSALPESWRPYHVEDAELLAQVFMLSRVCLEEDFKYNELNCLILARKAGPVFVGILTQVNLASCNLLEKDHEEFDSAGKD